MKPVMSYLVSAYGPLIALAKVRVQDNEPVPRDDLVHTLQFCKTVFVKDMYTQIVRDPERVARLAQPDDSPRFLYNSVGGVHN